jgi:hypothetical protein
MDLRVRARVHSRRQLVAQGHGAIFDELRDTFYAYDPLQLGAGGGNRDEYGSPVSTIIPLFERCATLEEACFAVKDEMRMHYPSASLGSTDLEKLASECWQKWLSFKRAR